MFVRINKYQSRLVKMMNKIMAKSIRSIFFSILLLISSSCIAQKSGYLQINGKIKKDNKPEMGVTIEVSASGTPTQSLSSKDNGSFNFNLDLQKNFTIKFMKNGLVTKVIEFNTTVPGDQSDIIYQKEFNMDLFSDVAGVSQEKAMNKPVAKFTYNPTYEDFEYDQTYSRQIQSEQETARKIAEDLNKQQERVRLDSLNKVWNDSLVKVKAREAELLAKKAEQDLIAAEQAKLKQDSITRVNAASSAAALAADREKNRLDSLAAVNAKMEASAAAKEKARQDSLGRASAEQVRLKELASLREKARQDSTTKAMANQAKADEIARAKAESLAKAKVESDKIAAENAKRDSIAKADLAERARLKAMADSADKAKADAKRSAELERIAEKSRKDSTDAAQARAKNRADRKSTRLNSSHPRLSRMPSSA